MKRARATWRFWAKDKKNEENRKRHFTAAREEIQYSIRLLDVVIESEKIIFFFAEILSPGESDIFHLFRFLIVEKKKQTRSGILFPMVIGLQLLTWSESERGHREGKTSNTWVKNRSGSISHCDGRRLGRTSLWTAESIKQFFVPRLLWKICSTVKLEMDEWRVT